MNFASAAYPRTVSDRLHSWIQLSSSTVVLCGSLLVLLSAGQAVAAVTTAISPTGGTGSPASLGTVITSGTSTVPTNLCTANCAITGGTRLGNNLFHSFGDFSIGALDGARFQTGLVNPLQDASVSNILGRVTEGNPSNIFGTLNTATYYPSANLFLMNPSGFVFGPNATLNVGGSVGFTTAQYIRLMDSLNFSSANFYANPANDGLANSILTINASAFEFLSASPAAYGFLTAPDPTATITVQGSNLSIPPALPDTPPNSISLIGGKVVIEGEAQLSAPNGRIHLATTASPGEFAAFEPLANATSLQSVPNNPVDPASATSFTSYGLMSLAPGSSIDVHGTSTVFIKGGKLLLSVNDATLSTSESPAPSGTISLGPGSSIVTSNSGIKPGADVQISVGNLSLDGSQIFTGTQGDGVGGNLFLNVGTLSLVGSQITSDTLGTGNGGQVSITATSLTATSLSLNDDSTILTSTNGIGRNGDITLSVQDASLSGRSTITSAPDTSGLAGAAGGKITVQGPLGEGTEANSVTLEGFRTGIIARSFGSALLGDIELHAKTVSVTGGAVIQAGSSFDSGTAGKITIEADSVEISGGGRISSEAFGANSGPVIITADQVTLDGGSIVTDTSSPTGGRGGDVVLNVGSLSLANTAAINSSASGTGPAGNINVVTSGSVTMTNSSTISASSTGSGNSGNITITALGPFTSNASTIATSAENAKGGDILINAQNVQLSNGNLISASSNAPFTQVGEGNAGNITITSDSNFIMQNSLMTTEAAHTSGGTIEIKSPEMVQLINSNIKTSVKGTQGDTAGGNITIDPQFVVLQNSQILAQANAGTGGDITITSNVFLADPTSVVDASSQLGVSGVVDIRSPVSNISGLIGRLPESVLAAQALLRAACAARLAESQVSSFVERGRDSIPIGPDGLLATPYLPPSSEPRTQMGEAVLGSGREAKGETFRTSGVQMRRLMGPDSIPRVQLLSGDTACGS